MPEYLAPGVFVEEIDSGSKPIEGVGVNTVAFVGYAKSGDFNKPTFISNWTQFCQTFGEDENSLLKALSDELDMTAAEVSAAKRASRKGWMEYAQVAVQKATETRRTSGRDGNGKAKNWPDFLKTHSISQNPTPYLEI